MGQCKMGANPSKGCASLQKPRAIPVALLVAPQDTVTLILGFAKIKFPDLEELNGSAQKQQSDCDSAGLLQT